MWPQAELVQHLKKRSAFINMTLEDITKDYRDLRNHLQHRRRRAFSPAADSTLRGGNRGPISGLSPGHFGLAADNGPFVRCSPLPKASGSGLRPKVLA